MVGNARWDASRLLKSRLAELIYDLISSQFFMREMTQTGDDSIFSGGMCLQCMSQLSFELVNNESSNLNRF